MRLPKPNPLYVKEPLPIASQIKTLQLLATALPPLNFDIPHINMARFSARYLCGGTSLREGRDISRKRLSIAMAGIPNEDVLSQSIAKKVEQYEVALQISTKQTMSIELLCDLHTLLCSEVELRGQIRNHQNWVGGKEIDSATIVPPPPEKAKAHLGEWQSFTEKEDLTDAAAALLAFSYFIVLHPFADGNGRLSRLLLTSFLVGDRPRKSFLSPVLFRLNHFEESKEELFATPRALLNGDWNNVIAYWHRAFVWQNAISEEITGYVLESRKILVNALLLVAKPDFAASLLDLLFEQPLVTLEYVCRQLNVDVLTANGLLESFCLHGVLKRFSLKQPTGTIIFSCEQVFNLWAIIDNLLFKTHTFGEGSNIENAREVLTV